MQKPRTKLQRHILVAIVGLLCLAGCKPKEATITGQVVVATQGGVGIRLGAVEVEIVEKAQVVDFLGTRNADLDVQTTKNQLDDVRKVIAYLKSEIERMQSYIGSQPSTNADAYLAAKVKITKCAEDQATWDNRLLLLQAAAASKTGVPSGRPTPNSPASNSVRTMEEGEASLNLVELLKRDPQFANQWDEVQQGRQQSSERYMVALQEMARMAGGGSAGVQQELDSIIRASAEAKGKERALERKLISPGSREDCFVSFAPTIAKSVNTDAEGNFTLSCPRNKAFTILAKAQRKSMALVPEKYVWLIDCPNKDARVLLNNNNLVEIDPDGYFKSKP